MSRLALGTVQFGLDYGIANTSGQVRYDEIKNILSLAKYHNIDIEHVGHRGGSVRTRYFGELEGVNPELRKNIYDIILTLNFNTNPTRKNKGSAIFIHIASKKYKSTKGCVAISKIDMRKLLKYINRNSRILID